MRLQVVVDKAREGHDAQDAWYVEDRDGFEEWGPYDTEAEAVRVKARLENEQYKS